jgi:putative FmdB family regulatory protein
MPIYAYRCAACGHAQDVLQKMSDAVLTQCPACGAQAYQKQVTAAGFQLKGSGWYVTDFRGGNTAKKEGDKPEGGDAKPAEGAPAKTEAASEAKPAEKSADKAATPAAAPAPAPTPASGS